MHIFSHISRICQLGKVHELIAQIVCTPVAKPAWRFSPVMQILKYFHYSFLKKFIAFTVNEHQNICIPELNYQAGYATAVLEKLVSSMGKKAKKNFFKAYGKPELL